MKKIIFKSLLALVLILSPRVMGTNSFFSSTATITGNTFSMAAAAPSCDSEPTEPVLLTPEDHATLATSEATFTWQAASSNCEGANLTYKLEAFENDNLHGTPVFSSDWQTGLSFHRSGITQKHIFWHVLVKDQFGNTNQTDVFHLNFDLDVSPPPPSSPDVVINEFLPDPAGADDAPRPNGEWVELYNRSASATYDLTGWSLQDASGHSLAMTLVNSTALSIAPHGFVVVYRNGNHSFSLNNSPAGDTIYLIDNHDTTIDSHAYSSSVGENVLENKSIARVPDGSNNWFDPIPTPLGPNRLEPTLTLEPTGDRHYFSFSIQGISAYKSFDYQVTYDTDGTTQGLQGSISLNNQSDYNHPQTIFGSCSSGGTCVYNSGVKNINLTVTLTGTDGSLLTLKKTVE